MCSFDLCSDMEVIQCVVCENKQIYTSASIWCNVCGGLCEDCNTSHSIFKRLTPSHDIISIYNRSELPRFIAEIKQTCDEHNQSNVLYCSIHDDQCCPECIALKHSTCTGFLSLENLSKTSIRTVTDIEQRLNGLILDVSTVIYNRKQALGTFQDKIGLVKDEVKFIRLEINALLDEMEDDLFRQIEEIYKTHKAKIEEVVSNLSQQAERLKGIQNDVFKMKEFGTGFQIFTACRQIKSSLEKEDYSFEQLFSDVDTLDQKDLDLNVASDGLLPAIEKLIGQIRNLKITETVCKVSLTRNNSVQCHLVQDDLHTIQNIKLFTWRCIDVTKDIPNRYLTDCIFRGNGNVLFADRSENKELILCNENGELCKTIKLKDNPYGVAKFGDQNIAVTLPEARETCVVNVDTSEETLHFCNFDKRCWGIATNKETRFVREFNKGILCIDLNGKVVQTLPAEGRITHLVYSEGKLYHTQNSPNIVTCCYEDGREIWKLAVEDEPYGIAVGKHGFLFVVLEKSNKLIVISNDGSVTRVLLSKENGLSLPYAVDYDSERDKLLLVKSETGLIEIYDVTY